MATSEEYIRFVCECLNKSGNMTQRKMFGEYMLYYDAKPVLTVCDNTVFVKRLPEVKALFDEYGVVCEEKTPYDGAKPHYVVDVENEAFSNALIELLAEITPFPKPKRKKRLLES